MLDLHLRNEIFLYIRFGTQTLITNRQNIQMWHFLLPRPRWFLVLCYVEFTSHSNAQFSLNSTAVKPSPWAGAQNRWSDSWLFALSTHFLLARISSSSSFVTSFVAYCIIVPTINLTCLYKKRSPVTSIQYVLQSPTGSHSAQSLPSSESEISNTVQCVSCSFPRSFPLNAPLNAIKSWWPHRTFAHYFALSVSNSVQCGMCHTSLWKVLSMCDRILISLAHEMIRQLTYNELDREIHRQKKCIDKSCVESQGMDETVYLPHHCHQLGLA